MNYKYHIAASHQPLTQKVLIRFQDNSYTIYVGKVALGQDSFLGISLLCFPSVRLIPPNIRIHFSHIYPRLIKRFCLSLQRYLKTVHIDGKSVENGKFSYICGSSTQKVFPQIVFTYFIRFFFLYFIFSIHCSFYLFYFSSSRSTRSLSKKFVGKMQFLLKICDSFNCISTYNSEIHQSGIHSPGIKKV